MPGAYELSEVRSAYIACPYSHIDPDVIEQRMKIFCEVAGKFEREGDWHVLSAMFNHLLIKYGVKVPSDWNFWKSYSLHMLGKCQMLIVIVIPGWKKSEGVQGEINYAKNRYIPIKYVDEHGNFIPEPKDTDTLPVGR